MQVKSLVCASKCARLNPPAKSVAELGLFDQIKVFFSKLFDTSDWPARWHCGNWSQFHGWLYIGSDLLIWLSYSTIPIFLFLLIKNRTDSYFNSIVWLFSAFIILCGMTHLIDAIIFWWPAYRVSALLRLFTGIISAVTAFALYKFLPVINSLRSVSELEAEISERKKAEERLANSEFLLSEAGRMGSVGGWEIDTVTNKIVWSKTVYDIHELDYSFHITLDSAYNFYCPPYRERIIEAIEECKKNGKIYEFEMQIRTAKDHKKWIRVRGEPLYNEEGKFVTLRGVLMDIDRYKINELSLNRSVELISQHNIQLKNFNHILSHNIRNHSSNLSMVASMMDKTAMDEENVEMFEKILKISKALDGTLNDLSQAIKIKESVLINETLNFEAVMRQVFQVIESMIDVNNVSIAHDFQVKEINFPRPYLKSIMMNLLTNAIKYRKEGVSPSITLKTYTNEQGKTVLECGDNGTGIDLEKHGKKIFGLYKVFHDRKDAHGVGLFLTKTQIESQDGEITAHSTLGVGSIFKIIFR